MRTPSRSRIAGHILPAFLALLIACGFFATALRLAFTREYALAIASASISTLAAIVVIIAMNGRAS